MCLSKSGIYAIRNKSSGKIYIGQTQNIEKRLSAHFRELKTGTHHNFGLQKDYAENIFECLVLILCDISELNKYEKFFIDFYSENCYNISREEPSTTRGIKYSKETKEYLSKINSGKNNPMYGRQHTQETKNKMSIKAKGERNSMYRYKRTKEQLANLSEKLSGENNPKAKLKKNDVLWIRNNKDNYTGIELSKIFSVSNRTISNVILGKSWKEGANHSCMVVGQNGGIKE